MIGKQWKKEILTRARQKPVQNEFKDKFVQEYVKKVEDKKKTIRKKRTRSPSTIRKTSLSPGHRFTSRKGPKPIRL